MASLNRNLHFTYQMNHLKQIYLIKRACSKNLEMHGMESAELECIPMKASGWVLLKINDRPAGSKSIYAS